MAPANVLHGAVRLQGFTSLPSPDTHVRVACVCAGTAPARRRAAPATTLNASFRCSARMRRSNGPMAYMADSPRRVTGAPVRLAWVAADLGGIGGSGMHGHRRVQRGTVA